MSCALVAFSGWKTLIPRPWMCVGNVTVTLLELSMEARHVHRYTLHNMHTYNLFKFDVCFFLSLPPDSFYLCFIFQVGGQCRCKIAVTGRQCSQCLPGWYGLEASNPEGCTGCNCTDVGIASNSSGVPTCNQDTGQCRCKAHVIGRKTSGKKF